MKEMLTVAAVIIIVLILLFIKPILGIFPFGPVSETAVTVQRLYVDYSGSGDSRASHYMVGTDKGVFEIDNSLWNWIWNADELYAKLVAGETYRVKTKGNKVVNFFFQKYPYIIEVRNETP